MRIFGAILAVVGLIWGIVAFNMSTSVETGGKSFGSSEFSIYVPRQEVHNLALAERRRTHLMISGVLVVIGSILFGFGSVRKSSDVASSADTRKCPFCAELVKVEARICKHCQKDLPEFTPEAVRQAGELESLHDAAWNGNWATVSRLLREGADVNQTNAEGKTALDVARARGDKQIVSLLLSNGASERQA